MSENNLAYPPVPAHQPPPPPGAPQKSFLTTWLLALFLGFWGVDRFYLGKVGTGLAKLLTFGGLGVWVLVDLIIVLAGGARDRNGLPLSGYQERKVMAWIVTGVLWLISAVGGAASAGAADDANLIAASPEPSITAEASVTPEATPTPTPTLTPTETATETAKPEPTEEAPVVDEGPTETVSQANARESAEAYLAFTSFSRSGLIEQLEFEGYATADAEYAVAAVEKTVDWSEQALASAEEYLDYTAFSYSGLIEQLEFEGFSSAQATYGVDNVTVDWNEQAVLSAEAYLEYTSFSRSGLIEQLEFEGFSSAQATYAADQVGL